MALTGTIGLLVGLLMLLLGCGLLLPFNNWWLMFIRKYPDVIIAVLSVIIIVVWYFRYRPMLEERHTGKARKPLPSDSALQKMDCKLVNEKEQTRAGSPSIKKQLASDRTIPSSQSTDEEASSPMMSAAKFYLSKVSKPEKIKISIQSNPASTAMFSKTEKHSTSSPNYSILKKKEVLTDEIFIQYMHSYLLTEEQLVENGYPRPTGDPGVASIVRKPGDVSDIKPIGPDAQMHFCSRCGTPFIIYNNGSYLSPEECCYHSKKLLEKKREYGRGKVSYYPCCRGNKRSSGCEIAKMHVSKGVKLPLESGYVQTCRHPNINHYTPTVYALDCEMCYTTAGLKLSRVSVVGTNNEIVYESLVKPDHPVVDYNTKFSGITAQDLVSVTTTLKDVQNDLLNLFYEDTILLGHSLEHDLQSLKIIHSCVVDTALVFPHSMGLPYKRALRNITAEFLDKMIQDEVDGGHDSKEDAIACMDLMKWKIKSDLQKTIRRDL